MNELRVLFTNAADTGYRAQLADAKGRRLGVEVPFTTFLTADDYEDLRWYLEEYLDLPDGGAVIRAQRIERDLAGWGRQLFKVLFTAEENLALLSQLLASPEPRGLTIAIGLFHGGVFEQVLLRVSQLAPEIWALIQRELQGIALLCIEDLQSVTSPFLRFHPTLASVATDSTLADNLEIRRRKRSSPQASGSRTIPALRLLAEEIKKRLPVSELVRVSKIVLLNSSDASVRALTSEHAVEHGRLEIDEASQYGLPVERGYVITSRAA